MYIQVAPPLLFFKRQPYLFGYLYTKKKFEKYSNILNELTPPQVLVIKIILDLQIISKIQDNCPPPVKIWLKCFRTGCFLFFFFFGLSRCINQKNYTVK